MIATNTLKKRNLRKQSQERRIRSGDDYADPCEGCNRFCKIRKLDFLGEPVNFNYKGSDTYESTLGACCSLLVAIVLLGYFMNGVLHLWYQTPRSISQFTYMNTPDSAESFDPINLGYEFAIGFMEER